MKNILLIILVLSFAVTCGPELPTVSNDRIIPWDGIEEKEPKLENSTYYIYEASELFWIAKKSVGSTFKNFTIKLEKDIDLANKPFPVICPDDDITGEGGRIEKAFRGNFEGNNKMIMNVNIGNPTSEYQAFIGNMVKGTIKNLILTNGTVVGKNYVAGLVANIFTDLDEEATLENCTTYLNIKMEYITTGGSAGGLVARASGVYANRTLNILTSTNHGTVVSKYTTGKLGGIFGYFSSGVVSNCVNFNASPMYGATAATVDIYENSIKQ